jgi:uncharacterized oligopeptide transporter (OPT) family protein
MPARRALHVRLPGLCGLLDQEYPAHCCGQDGETTVRGVIAELIEIVGGWAQVRLGMAEGAVFFGYIIFGYFLACALH